MESSNQLPDGNMLRRFRNLMIHNRMQKKLFIQMVKQLEARGLLLKKGTIVDSTLIFAPSRTKNAKKKQDPEAHLAKKGNNWYCDYKAHIGIDKDIGPVYTLRTTAANIYDIPMMS